MEYLQLWFFEEGRDLFKVIRRYWLLNVKCFNKAQMPIKKIFLWSVGLSLAAFSSVWSAEEPSLWQIQQILAGKRYVDLTHEFAPGIPHWPGFPDEARKTIYWYEKRSNVMGTGFFSELYTHVGQWGTHVDPPAHFIKGLRTVDQIDLKEMILPLVIIDVHEDVAKNPDYTLSIERLRKWEKASSRIRKAAQDSLRGYLRFYRNLTHTRRDANRRRDGFAR